MSNIFDLLLSPDVDVAQSTSKLVSLMAYSNPQVFIDNFEQLRLIVMALCCSPYPSFSTITIIINGITNGIENNTELYNEYIMPLLLLSYDISQAFLKNPTSCTQFYPDMSAIVRLILNQVKRKNPLTLEMIIAIAEHSSIGYLPFISYDEIIIDYLEDVVKIICSAENVGEVLSKILKAIVSPNPKTAVIYNVIVLSVMCELGNQPGIINATMEHSTIILSLIEKLPSNLSFLPSVLLLTTRSFPSEFSKIQVILKKELPNIIETLRNDRRQILNSAESRAEVKTNYTLHRTQVSILENTRLFSKKWNNTWLSLLEEPQILMWSPDKTNNKGGVAVYISEVSKLEVLQENTNEQGRKNIMKITVGKDTYTFSFSNYEDALQWNNIFKQLKSK